MTYDSIHYTVNASMLTSTLYILYHNSSAWFPVGNQTQIETTGTTDEALLLYLHDLLNINITIHLQYVG